MQIDSPASTPHAASLDPLPYHVKMREHLKWEEPELWNWFSSNKVRAEHAEAVRLDLLKSTYRVEPATQPQLYELAKEVSSKLELDVPVMFYQGQSGGGLNAALAFLPSEAHIMLIGPVLNALSAAELQA